MKTQYVVGSTDLLTEDRDQLIARKLREHGDGIRRKADEHRRQAAAGSATSTPSASPRLLDETRRALEQERWAAIKAEWTNPEQARQREIQNRQAIIATARQAGRMDIVHAQEDIIASIDLDDEDRLAADMMRMRYSEYKNLKEVTA